MAARGEGAGERAPEFVFHLDQLAAQPLPAWGVEGLLRFTESQTIATQRLVGLGVPPGVPSRVYAAAATGGLRLLRRLGRR